MTQADWLIVVAHLSGLIVGAGLVVMYWALSSPTSRASSSPDSRPPSEPLGTRQMPSRVSLSLGEMEKMRLLKWLHILDHDLETKERWCPFCLTIPFAPGPSSGAATESTAATPPGRSTS